MSSLRLTRLSRAAVVASVALLATASGCLSVSARPNPGRGVSQGSLPEARLPKRGDEPRTHDRHGDPAAALAKREVASKDPPASLVASDGLRCSVSRDRYESTQVGDSVLCLWTANADRADRPKSP